MTTPSKFIENANLLERIEENPVNQELRRQFPQDLHKEIWGHTKGEPDETLYRWWWEFMHASQEFPEIRDSVGQTPTAQAAIQNTQDKFGELGDSFKEWWDRKGHDLFAERGVPLVTVLMPRPDDEAFKEANGVVVMIPLSISRELILKQLNVVLKAYHKGNELKRHEASTAQLTIYPRPMYPKTGYEVLVKIWRARAKNVRMDNSKAWWELLCDATGNEELRRSIAVPTRENTRRRVVRDEADRAEARLKIGKQAEILYQQADVLMRHAILGDFPRDDDFQTKKRG